MTGNGLHQPSLRRWPPLAPATPRRPARPAASSQAANWPNAQLARRSRDGERTPLLLLRHAESKPPDTSCERRQPRVSLARECGPCAGGQLTGSRGQAAGARWAVPHPLADERAGDDEGDVHRVALCGGRGAVSERGARGRAGRVPVSRPGKLPQQPTWPALARLAYRMVSQLRVVRHGTAPAQLAHLARRLTPAEQMDAPAASPDSDTARLKRLLRDTFRDAVETRARLRLLEEVSLASAQSGPTPRFSGRLVSGDARSAGEVRWGGCCACLRLLTGRAGRRPGWSCRWMRRCTFRWKRP